MLHSLYFSGLPILYINPLMFHYSIAYCLNLGKLFSSFSKKVKQGSGEGGMIIEENHTPISCDQRLHRYLWTKTSRKDFESLESFINTMEQKNLRITPQEEKENHFISVVSSHLPNWHPIFPARKSSSLQPPKPLSMVPLWSFTVHTGKAEIY